MGNRFQEDFCFDGSLTIKIKMPFVPNVRLEKIDIDKCSNFADDTISRDCNRASSFKKTIIRNGNDII